MLSLLGRIDIMVRLLFAAMVLAVLAPAVGPWRDTAQWISSGAIFILFFLNGVRLPRQAIADGMRNLRFLLPLALWSFGLMALAGFGLFKAGQPFLPGLVAIGLLYLGVMPSTVQSATAYTSLAEGNVATSVVAAGLLNILGVFVSAPLFTALSGGAEVDLGLAGLQRIGLILVLPFLLGQIVQARLAPVLKNRASLVSWTDRFSIAIAVYVAFSGAVEQDLWGSLNASAWICLLALLGAALVFGYGGAWFVSGALRLPLDERISFTYAGAHKSIAMGAPLALVLFPPEAAGLILVPLLIYHLLQLIVSAPLATRFRQMQR